MNVAPVSRTVCGLCTIVLMLTACGGGGSDNPSPPTPPPSGNNPGGQPPGPGGPDSPPPPAGQQPTFAIADTSIELLSPIPNYTPEPRRIPITINGSVNGLLYIVTSISEGSRISYSLTYSSKSGQTPTIDAFANPMAAHTQLAGTYSSEITFTACVDDPTCKTGQLPGSPQTVKVTYILKSDVQGDVVAPRVVTAGEGGTFTLRGRGFSQATTVRLGDTPATSMKLSELAPGEEISGTYPALPPGTYPVSINSGGIAFTGSLVAVARPNYAASKLTYPAEPQEIGGMVYDAQRQAIFVAARYANSQTNRLYKFQFTAGAWQAPVAVTEPNLRDIALSPDGARLLLATDTSITELDVTTLARTGTYSPSDELINAGTAYIQSLAVAADGFAVVTTGGANPSNILLYSTTTHEFFRMNSAPGNLQANLDPRLYFGNPGVSADGALVVLTQDPRTAGGRPDSASKPFVYLYSATQSQRGILFGSLRSTFTDKDRSQLPRSARPAVNHRLAVSGTRIVVNGAPTSVLGADYEGRGSLPETTLAAVFKPDASTVYAFDAPAGSQNGALLSYDVNTRLNPPDQMYLPAGAGIPMSPGSGTGAIAMDITHDGGTVFVVGTSGVYVQPAP